MRTPLDNPDPAPPPSVNRQAIRRLSAGKYLVWMLLSFAASVSSTRLFLELTGYPRIGGREIHIAHVLWGGLLLFIAALLPLIWANRWVYRANAILTGVGIGLFIDEVGKFITLNNDYFYPAAAPIIYVFFLMTVLMYILVSRPRLADDRTEFYYILEELEEVLNHDLSDDERAQILNRLEGVSARNLDPAFAALASKLAEFLNSDSLYLKPTAPGAWTHLLKNAEKMEQRIFTQNRLRASLVGGLLAIGFKMLSYPVGVLASLRSSAEFSILLEDLVARQLVRGSLTLNLFNLRLGLESFMSFTLLIAAVLFALKHDHRALFIAYFSLLGALTIVDPLLFYFEQFSAIITALIQFVLLLAIVRFRKRFMKKSSEITI
ncbi:MAG: hypothetical protein IT308_06390 [Anaerolineaceae bacterium]|nr:hypothetical protein [Anaerolineaceae bacterium]